MLQTVHILLIVLYGFSVNSANENVCTINGKKSLNTISENFLSVSIDPALIFSHTSPFTNKNSSKVAAWKLARFMAPAYVRVSGPSTDFLRIGEVQNSTSNTLTITPELWKSFNVWIKRTKMTPIFAVNDRYSEENTLWNPNALEPLLKLNERMDFLCYWQLGHDCNYKTLSQYKEDLQKFRQYLDSLSTQQPYKVLGSNLHSCLAHRTPELIGKFLEDLEYTADAIIWETDSSAKWIPFMPKSYMPVWLVAPKDSNPISFMSSLHWAKQIGDAAKAGYKVIFRQPRIHELYTDTPVYWVSLMFKTLMGSTVLDITNKNEIHDNTYTYAHCTKNQMPNQGTITLLIVNNGVDQYTTYVRLASSSQPKIVEIETYVLTSESGDSRNTYLNDAKLSMDGLRDYPYKPTPKIRRVKVDKLVSLSVPAKSIGFFVLLLAKVKVCMDTANQNMLLAKEAHSQITAENQLGNLQDFYKSLDKEIKEDENFYGKNDAVQAVNKPEKLKFNTFKDVNRIIKEKRWKNPLQNLKNLPHDDIYQRKLDLELNKEKKLLPNKERKPIWLSNMQLKNSESQNQTNEARTMQKRNNLLRLRTQNWRQNLRNKTRALKVNHNKKREINMDLLRTTDLVHPPLKPKFLPKHYSYKNIELLHQPSTEDDFESQEMNNYYKPTRKDQQNIYEDDDERITFLSEAGAFRSPRVPRSARNLTNLGHTFQNLKSKQSENNSKFKATKDKFFTHLQERKQNRIEKLKQRKQKIRNIMDKNAQRHKRATLNEKAPTMKPNLFQVYAENENRVSTTWKPQDVLNIKKAIPYSLEHIDSIEYLQFHPCKSCNKISRLQKRNIKEENAIDFPFDDVYKEQDLYNERDNYYHANYTTDTYTTIGTTTTAEKQTEAPTVSPNSFINIVSDTKTDNENGNSQQTKITINEESLANIITVTGTILQNIAANFAGLFL